jgi:hypothetical protein
MKVLISLEFKDIDVYSEEAARILMKLDLACINIRSEFNAKACRIENWGLLPEPEVKVSN